MEEDSPVKKLVLRQEVIITIYVVCVCLLTSACFYQPVDVVCWNVTVQLSCPLSKQSFQSWRSKTVWNEMLNGWTGNDCNKQFA